MVAPEEIFFRFLLHQTAYSGYLANSGVVLQVLCTPVNESADPGAYIVPLFD